MAVRPGYNRTMFPESPEENAIYRGVEVAQPLPQTQQDVANAISRVQPAVSGVRPGYDRTQFPTTEAENTLYRGGPPANVAGSSQPGQPGVAYLDLPSLNGVRQGYNRTMFPETEAENAIYRGGSAAQPSTNTPLTPESGGGQPISSLLGGSSRLVQENINRAQPALQSKAVSALYRGGWTDPNGAWAAPQSAGGGNPAASTTSNFNQSTPEIQPGAAPIRSNGPWSPQTNGFPTQVQGRGFPTQTGQDPSMQLQRNLSGRSR